MITLSLAGRLAYVGLTSGRTGQWLGSSPVLEMMHGRFCGWDGCKRRMRNACLGCYQLMPHRLSPACAAWPVTCLCCKAQPSALR
eukprot:358738-Chlamydomonas_euryale.AAC.3